MAEKRPQNVGEVLLKSLAAGVGGVAQGLDQRRQNELQMRTQKLQNFMSVMEFERAERDRIASNLRAQQTSQQITINEQKIENIATFNSLPKEQQDLYVTPENYAKVSAIKAQNKIEDDRRRQFLGDLPDYLKTFGRTADEIDVVNMDTGSLNFFSPKESGAGAGAGAGNGTLTERDRAFWLGRISPNAPPEVVQTAQFYINQDILPADLAKSGLAQYNRTIGQAMGGMMNIDGATNLQKAASSAQSGYSPEYGNTLDGVLLERAIAPKGEELSDEAIELLRVYFDNLNQMTGLYLEGLAPDGTVTLPLEDSGQ